MLNLNFLFNVFLFISVTISFIIIPISSMYLGLEILICTKILKNRHIIIKSIIFAIIAINFLFLSTIILFLFYFKAIELLPIPIIGMTVLYIIILSPLLLYVFNFKKAYKLSIKLLKFVTFFTSIFCLMATICSYFYRYDLGLSIKCRVSLLELAYKNSLSTLYLSILVFLLLIIIALTNLNWSMNFLNYQIIKPQKKIITIINIFIGFFGQIITFFIPIVFFLWLLFYVDLYKV